MRILSKDLADHAGRQATVSGWLHKKRAMGSLMFVVLRDRGGLIQIVVGSETEQEKLRGAQVGSILTITGDVVEEKRAAGGVEIHEPVISVDIEVTEPPLIEIDKPIDHTPENLETLFENRVINLRNVSEQGIFKVQAAVGHAIRDYFDSHQFVEIHTPKLLAEPTEGGAEVFKMDYFDNTATLAQSPQFYKQIMVGIFERVYEIGAVYRAEPSMTTRHMTEYTSVDGEMGYIESFQEVLDFLSGMLNHIADDVWKSAKSELEALGSTKPVLAAKIPEMTLAELHKRFTEDTGHDTTKEKDPTPAEERWASKYAAENLDSEAIFITKFPSSAMKFYHKRDEANNAVAVRADLLFRGVEIVTASQRENNYDKLLGQLKGMGGDPEHPGFKPLVQAMQFGMPAHGGFGMGLERVTQELVGLNNVKEATLFPRDMNRLTP